MNYTIRLGKDSIGPASADEIASYLKGRKLTGSEPVTYHSRLGDTFGQARSFPEFKSLIGQPAPRGHEVNSSGPQSHVPNHIPLNKRLLAILVICVSGFVLYEYITTGQTTLSTGKRGPSLAVTGWWGLPAVAMFGGALSAGLALIVDHYDRRPNENFYSIWTNVSLLAMVLGKFAALIIIHQLKT